MPAPLRLLVLFALLAAAAAAALAAAPARAAAPCWKEVINDWLDGSIDKTYPAHCYREALRHLPVDIDTYSSARDDISRALAMAIAGRDTPPTAGGGAPGKPGSSGSPAGGRDKGPGSGAKGSTSGSGGSSGQGGAGGTGTAGSGGPGRGATGGAPAPGRDKGRGGPVGSAIKEVGPDSAEGLPIPLIVLGSVAALLLLLGSAGFLARRLQARRGVRPAADSRPQKP